MIKILLLLEIIVVSTALYVFVHRKTHISLSYLYKDNVVNIVLVAGIIYVSMHLMKAWMIAMGLPIIVGVCATLLFIIRFYRRPIWRMCIMRRRGGGNSQATK